MKLVLLASAIIASASVARAGLLLPCFCGTVAHPGYANYCGSRSLAIIEAAPLVGLCNPNVVYECDATGSPVNVVMDCGLKGCKQVDDESGKVVGKDACNE